MLGRERGKFSSFARGARKSKKRFSGGIDILDLAIVSTEDPRRGSGLPTISEYRLFREMRGLRESVTSFANACLCCEIIDALCKEDDPDATQYYELLFPVIQLLEKAAKESNTALSYSVTTFCTLRALEVSGFFAIEEVKGIGEHEMSWYRAMSEQRAPIVPFDKSIIRPGLKSIAQHFSQLTDKKLHSLDAIQSLF